MTNTYSNYRKKILLTKMKKPAYTRARCSLTFGTRAPGLNFLRAEVMFQTGAKLKKWSKTPEQKKTRHKKTQLEWFAGCSLKPSKLSNMRPKGKSLHPRSYQTQHLQIS
jgi:hypothetical protein